MYTCTKCKKPFKGKTTFLRHLESHLDNAQSCIKCKRTCNNETSFEYHWRLCGFRKPKKGRFGCIKCERKFTTKPSLIRHQKAHLDNSCSKCNVSITDQRVLIKHMLEVHQIQLKASYLCEVCDSSFTKKSSYFKHLSGHLIHEVICTRCGLVLDDNDKLEQHLKVHEDKKILICEKCGKKFERSQQYRDHIYKHLEGKEKKVSKPNKKKASKKEENLASCQGKTTNFQEAILCHFCGISFRALSTYYDHLKYSHGEKPLKKEKCSICNKEFQKKSILTKHLLTHSQERPFKCGLCEKTYKNLTHLRRHEKGHQDGA